MKSRFLFTTAGFLLLIAFVLLLLNWSAEDPPAYDSADPQPRPSARSLSISNSPPAPRNGNNTNTLPAFPVGKEDILAVIHEASVTYDPRQLPKIAAFLHHPDAQIRQGAIDGMIVLGDSAAAPLLREAAQSASSPQEAVALENAAAYIELPSARNVLPGKKNQSTVHPIEQDPP